MNDYLRNNRAFVISNIFLIVFLLIITISGVCSFNTANTYEITNQYGDTVKMWGYGVYTHDSFFKAPIFIGSDFTILLFIVPLAIFTFIKTIKNTTAENYIYSFGVLGALLYYSSSLAFGVTYNILHLLYIALFGLCFFGVGFLFVKLHGLSICKNKVCTYTFTLGMKIFLIVAGVSLFVAWLPDIVTSIINGTSLELIEVYTTEITYVLDMGIVSPLMFITYYLLKMNSFVGYVLLRMILKICMVVGIMLPLQTVFQLMAGISVPIPALCTKVLIFVMLAGFALYFEHKLKKNTIYS